MRFEGQKGVNEMRQQANYSKQRENHGEGYCKGRRLENEEKPTV